MSQTTAEPPLQCSLPPREALRRAMMVEPPMDWKKAKKISKPSKKKVSRQAAAKTASARFLLLKADYL
jgi:hypothetical protein